MKKTAILFMLLVLTPFFTFTQTTEAFESISPFYEGFAAVKKGAQWAFIDTEGTIVIDFRDDLKTTNTGEGAYPIFKNGRCLITKEENKISYFGYIDTSGKTIILPTFLAATNFQNNLAVVVELKKEIVGYNNVLGKNIVYYSYLEAIINKDGKIIEQLTAPKNIVLETKFLPTLPKITSKILSEKLVAYLNKDQKWMVKKITSL